jgi:hypothetical protein
MIIDILAVIVVGAVGLRYLARHERKPVKLTDEQKLEQRRRDEKRARDAVNRAYELDGAADTQWWI